MVSSCVAVSKGCGHAAFVCLTEILASFAQRPKEIFIGQKTQVGHLDETTVPSFFSFFIHSFSVVLIFILAVPVWQEVLNTGRQTVNAICLITKKWSEKIQRWMKMLSLSLEFVPFMKKTDKIKC